MIELSYLLHQHQHWCRKRHFGTWHLVEILP